LVKFPAIELTESGEFLPRAGDAAHVGLSAQSARRCRTSRATRVTSAGERVELIDHRVDGGLELEHLAAHRDGDLLGEVAIATAVVTSAMLRTCAVRVAGHLLTEVGEVFPGSGDAFDLRLTAQPSFGADFARDARHLAGERVELVDLVLTVTLRSATSPYDVDGESSWRGRPWTAVVTSAMLRT